MYLQACCFFTCWCYWWNLSLPEMSLTKHSFVLKDRLSNKTSIKFFVHNLAFKSKIVWSRTGLVHGSQYYIWGRVEMGFPALITGERIAKLACCCAWKVAQRDWVCVLLSAVLSPWDAYQWVSQNCETALVVWRVDKLICLILDTNKCNWDFRIVIIAVLVTWNDWLWIRIILLLMLMFRCIAAHI